jgi:Protein of unknown function (DUF3631)
MDKRILKRIRDLHAMIGSSNPEERERAREKLEALLRKHNKTWNDLAELLHQQEHDSAGPAHDPRDDVPAGAGPDINVSANAGPDPSALDLVHYFLQDFVEMRSHEYIAVALWALHTHVFDQFMVTPRLALVSPVRGCGKTVLLDVLKCLVPIPHKTDHASAAGIYDLAHRRHTLLVDEADNLDLADNQALRAVLNSGHSRGGQVTRFQKTYSTFTPMAIAAIGTLPLPTMSRSVVINMARAARKLRRFDPNDQQDLDIAYSMSRAWARSVKLNSDPELPEVLRNRPADNWRSLIAIADTFGPAWGERAREAAIEFSKGYNDEDLTVLLLQDIRKIFYEKFPAVLSFPSSLLVAALNTLEGAPWSE